MTLAHAITPGRPVDCPTVLAVDAMSHEESPDQDSSAAGSAGVAHGPQWYRRRIRWWGPLLAFVVPGVLGALAWAIRELFSGGASGWTSVLLDVWSAPGLLAVGAPLATSDERPIGIVVSVALWLLVGFAAARVATRNPVATFRDFWRANLWLTGGVFLGAVLAIVLVAGVLGRQLL